jgi:hypothetical protein
MFGRPFRIFLLAFQAVWLGAIVPGHTRGVVTLPGSEPAAGGCCASAEAKACHADGSPADGENRPGDGKRGAGDPAGRAARCALCFFAARLTLPPVIDLAAPALELLAVLSADVPPDVVSRPPLLPYLARGPPTA